MFSSTPSILTRFFAIGQKCRRELLIARIITDYHKLNKPYLNHIPLTSVAFNGLTNRPSYGLWSLSVINRLTHQSIVASLRRCVRPKFFTSYRSDFILGAETER